MTGGGGGGGATSGSVARVGTRNRCLDVFESVAGSGNWQMAMPLLLLNIVIHRAYNSQDTAMLSGSSLLDTNPKYITVHACDRGVEAVV